MTYLKTASQNLSPAGKTLTIVTCVFSLIGALALSVESFLSLGGKSLCRTTACEIVGKYLVFGEPVLIAAGALLFWCLTLLLFFSYRYPKQFSTLPFLLLAVALSFDGALIGFQFFTIGQKCQFCIGVASFLLLVTLLYCLAQRKAVLLTCLLLAWLGGFASQSILEMPEPGGAMKEMVFYTRPATETPTGQSVVFTLIFSMNCPHCLEVVDTLSTMDTQAQIWKFAAIDRDHDSLTKLSSFIRQAPHADNPFQLLREIKEGNTSEAPINPMLKKRAKKALSFLSNTGIKAVPTLIIVSSENERRILTGSDVILREMNNESFLSR